MIKNLLYKISGITPLSQEEIKQSVQSETQDQKIYNNAIFSVNFVVDNQGQLFIESKWIDESSFMEDVIANFMFMLNNGDLNNHIFNYFNGIKTLNNDVKYNKFVDHIIQKWSMLIQKKNDIDNSPIVRPSQALIFNQSRQTPQPQNNDDE